MAANCLSGDDCTASSQSSERMPASTMSGRSHSITGDDQRLRETAVAVGDASPRTMASRVGSSAQRGRAADRRAPDVVLPAVLSPWKALQVLVDAEERVGPGSRTREGRHRRNGGVEEIASETLATGIARPSDDGAERPQRSPMAVLRPAWLQPVPRVRQEVPEAPGRSIEGVTDKCEIPRRRAPGRPPGHRCLRLRGGP